MKKNITINLFGTLYNIDEDAYELLENYQKNMHRYFSLQEGGEEIANDIEYRVAELLSEIKNTGVDAITIEHVEDIIKRVGNPEEMMDEDVDGSDRASTEDESKSQPWGDTTLGKRLYRDPKDCMLGGVLSGLSHYFGIEDPIVFRLLFVILLIFSWSSIAIVYILLWILVPKAITPEDRLRMYGKPVNVDSIREEIVESFNSAKSYMAGNKVEPKARGFITTVLSVLIAIFKAFCVILLVCGIMAIIGCILMLIVALVPSMREVFGMDGYYAEALLSPSNLVMFILAIVSWAIVILIPFVSLVRSFKSNSKEVSYASKWTISISWIVAFVAAVVFTSICSRKITRYSDELWENACVYDDVSMSQHYYEYLNDNGYHIAKLENFNRNNLTDYINVPFGDRAIECLSLEQDKNSKEPLVFDLYKEEQLEPGKYMLSAWIYTDKVNRGDAVYISVDSKRLIDVTTPCLSGNISEREIIRQKKRFLLDPINKDSMKISDLEQLETYLEHGWHYMQIPFDVAKGQIVKFGVSNMKKYTNEQYVGSGAYVYDLRIQNLNPIDTVDINKKLIEEMKEPKSIAKESKAEVKVKKTNLKLNNSVAVKQK
ncbi:PspC domain-containing protein [Falsiporphyromonas endometrii]|uniref:PspC domain-containing protein n=1 Tax=Falsiporphyromonas endometrii TaxID=1387297 RepID=A0ABV9K660_9PORP